MNELIYWVLQHGVEIVGALLFLILILAFSFVTTSIIHSAKELSNQHEKRRKNRHKRQAQFKKEVRALDEQWAAARRRHVIHPLEDDRDQG